MCSSSGGEKTSTTVFIQPIYKMSRDLEGCFSWQTPWIIYNQRSKQTKFQPETFQGW